MQNERRRDLSDPFNMFGGFGNFGGFGGSIFGRNPFDDPFFTCPFGSIFGPSNPLDESPQAIPPNEPIIKELGSDDDDDEGDQEMVNRGEESERSDRPTNEPFIDHPDDDSDDGKKHASYRTDYNQAEGTQPRSFKVHSCKVTHGGVDGVYYSTSATRRMGSDGVIMEECKEADKRTGEATHRISRGLHDKGHSVTRRLNSDGKVDTLQTLHNLHEDELGSFEDAWRGNNIKHLPPWSGASGSRADQMPDWGGLLPSTGRMGETQGRATDNEASGGRSRKVVRIPID